MSDFLAVVFGAQAGSSAIWTSATGMRAGYLPEIWDITGNYAGISPWPLEYAVSSGYQQFRHFLPGWPGRF